MNWHISANYRKLTKLHDAKVRNKMEILKLQKTLFPTSNVQNVYLFANSTNLALLVVLRNIIISCFEPFSLMTAVLMYCTYIACSEAHFI